MYADERRERKAQRRFQRRAILLLGAQAAVAGALGSRLWQLQVVEGEAYQTLAEENRVNVQTIAAPRGVILDRFGAPLAVNRPNYTARLIAERTEDLETTLTRLRRLLDLDDRDMRLIDRALQRNRGFVPITVAENLSWEAFARLNANAPVLPGVVTEAGLVREYPEQDLLAHVIGYVAAVTDEELEEDRSGDPSLRLPDARIGKNGVERALEPQLRGSAGSRRIEVNAGGREIRELEKDPGVAGDALTLTIDIELQRYAMERLKGESAAAVLMDIRSGDVLALASAPAYDPNKFVFGISHADWSALRDDEYDPLRNKAVTGQYPPGSTYKMLTALAALEAGVMTPRTTVRCSGSMMVGNRRFHCWKRQGHGAMRLNSSLQQSCDIYYYEAARRAGIERVADVSRRFGVGVRPPLEMPNVKPGNMPTPDWLFAARGLRWSGGDTVNVGIGQGALLMTPLQLAVMAARIANGREQVAPRLVRAVNGVEFPPEPFEPLGVSAEHLALIQEGMNAVTNVPGGTAFRSRITDEDNLIAGKTGTAQVRRISMAERAAGVRRNSDLPWHLRDHALYVAYAPYHAPRYAIGVVVEHGGSGSRSAAPVARDIMMRALYGPQPPLEAYPPHMRQEVEAARRAAEAARENPDALFGVVQEQG